MKNVPTPAAQMEAARATLRSHVAPHLNAAGLKTLDAFLDNPVLQPSQTLEDVALDITASDHVTRTFKEGEVIAIAALLESFATGKQQYLHIQAVSAKAKHVQEHIDTLDGALFASGADYTKLGQLIGGMRTLVSTRDKQDVIHWFYDNAAKLGVNLQPSAATAQAVEKTLGLIQDVIDAPSMAEKLANRPKRVIEVG